VGALHLRLVKTRLGHGDAVSSFYMRKIHGNKKTLSLQLTSIFAAFPKETQKILKELRTVIKEAAPDARKKSLSNAHLLLERQPCHFAAHKNHIGFYPTPSAIQAFESELSKYESSKGAGAISDG